MQTNQFKTPILFLAYNRPDTTALVFEMIRTVKPEKLYIAVDGPREGIEGENEKINKVKKIVSQIDWPCETKKLFREKNQGLKIGISDAITWFFKNEERGIILEDDCVPGRSFFDFCENMLDQFRDDKSIWMINGFNPKHQGIKTSKIFLSQNPSCWGWASWRDRWEKYDVNMLSRNNQNLRLYGNIPKYVYQYYEDAFENTHKGIINSWAYQLTWLILINRGFVIKPYSNLISNIGTHGTHVANKSHPNYHTKVGSFFKKNIYELKFDPNEDLWFYKTRMKKSVIFYILNKIKKIKRFFS